MLKRYDHFNVMNVMKSVNVLYIVLNVLYLTLSISSDCLYDCLYSSVENAFPG